MEVARIMTTTYAAQHRGVPTLHLDGYPMPATVAYVRPEYIGPFLKAGFRLFTVTTPARHRGRLLWLCL